MPNVDKVDVRETIIKVAQDVFAKFGFRKTTMDEIAEAARKAKSSVYHYFESKEEIFKTIVEREGETLGNCLIEIVSRVNSPEEKIRLYVLTRMKEIHRLLNFYSAIKDDYLDHYAFIEKIRSEHDKKEKQIISGMLKEGIEKGVFDPNIDIESLAHSLVIALKGFEHEWIRAKDISNLEKTLSDLVGYLMNGIVKK
jgi:AcrR family transcriptional regulator